MAVDNGPSRDVSPAANPSYKKPDPHLSDDPGPPKHFPPYRTTDDKDTDTALQYPSTRLQGVKGK